MRRCASCMQVSLGCGAATGRVATKRSRRRNAWSAAGQQSHKQSFKVRSGGMETLTVSNSAAENRTIHAEVRFAETLDLI